MRFCETIVVLVCESGRVVPPFPLRNAFGIEADAVQLDPIGLGPRRFGVAALGEGQFDSSRGGQYLLLPFRLQYQC